MYRRADVLFTSYREQVETILLSKAKAWAHEAEWRIVDPESGPGLQRFPTHLLRAVIFGARIAHDVRDHLSALALKRQPPPLLCQADVSEIKYGLTIRRLN